MRTKITLLTLTLIAIFSFTKVNAQFTGPAPLWTTAGGDMFGFGGIMPNFTIDVNGNINLNGAYKYGGADFLKLSNIDNILLGINAGTGTTGRYNVFVGNNAGANNIGGKSNSFFGYDAGNANQGGQKNTFIGYNTGYLNTSENYNSYFGFNAYGAAGISNATAIGSNAYVAQSNSLVLGGIGAYAVNVGIGTSTPLDALDVTGVIRSSSLSGTGTSFVFANSSGELVRSGPSFYPFWLSMGNSSTLPLSLGATSGGTDYIGTADATDFNIGTNGVKQIHVVGISGSSFGNVGIGFATTVSPAFKLDVVGDINISSSHAYKYNGLDLLQLYGSTNSNLLLGTNAGTALFTAITAGTDNLFVGNYAGNYNTSGIENTYIGGNAGIHSSGASNNNTCVGYNAGFGSGATTIDYNNTFIGHQAGYSISTGVENTIMGKDAGYHLTGGDFNTFIGKESGFNNTIQSAITISPTVPYTISIHLTGDQMGNTFVGFSSGHNNTIGDANVFTGRDAGFLNTEGIFNCFYGYRAGYNNLKGSQNTMIGNYAGINGSSLGTSSSTIQFEGNVFLGSGSGQFYNGKQNTFLGTNTCTYGEGNVLVGYEASAGGAVTAIGALSAPTSWQTVTSSISMGVHANVSADHSISIGDYSNINFCPTCTSSVDNSLVIGSHASILNTTSAPITNATAIGAYANVTSSNTMALGGTYNSGPSATSAEVTVVIGMPNSVSLPTTYISPTSPSTTSTVVSLETNSDILVQGAVYYSSDKRFKKNIVDFKNAKDIIKKMHPVKYEYRDDIYYKESGSDKDSKTKIGFTQGEQIGFLAQELQQYLPQAVKVRSDGYLAVNYNHLFGVAIQGLKEQDSELVQHKLIIDSLKIAVSGIQSQNLQIENQKEIIDSLKSENTKLWNEISNINNRLTQCCNASSSLQGKANIGNGKSATGKVELLGDGLNGNNSYLKQNNPNPFKDNTIIEYYLVSNVQNASLLLFDMNGKLLKTIPINQAGNGSIQIIGGELKAGMYFYSLIADDKEVDTKKMIILE